MARYEQIFNKILKGNGWNQSLKLFSDIVEIDANTLRKYYKEEPARFFKLLDIAKAQFNPLVDKLISNYSNKAIIVDLGNWEKVVYSKTRRFTKHFIKEPVLHIKGVWWSSTEMGVNCLVKGGEQLFVIGIDSWIDFYEAVNNG